MVEIILLSDDTLKFISSAFVRSTRIGRKERRNLREQNWTLKQKKSLVV